MIWFLFVLIVGFFAIYALSPFLDRSYRNRLILPDTGEREKLAHRKDEILDAINDLDFDFHMKKISEPDYLQLKEKLTREAIAVMKRLDQLEGIVHSDDIGARTTGTKAGKIRS